MDDSGFHVHDDEYNHDHDDRRERSFVLCTWTTIYSTATSFVQDQSQWVDLHGYNDATFVIDIANVTNPSGGLVLLYIESTPSLDGSAVHTIVGPIACAPTTAGSPLTLKTCSAGQTPVARYVRWRIASSVASGSFDVTFRVRGSANRRFYFAPTQLGGCVFWLRADLGLSFTNTGVTGWSDQSGLNDAGRNLVAGSSPPTITLSDANYGGRMTMAFSGSASCYFANASTWSPVVVQPRTWVLVGHRTLTSGTNYFLDGNSGSGHGDTVFVSSTGVITVSSGSSQFSSTGNNWNTYPTAFMYESVSGTSTAYQLNSFSTVLVSGGAGSNDFNSISLGSRNLVTGGGGTWVGTIAEVIAFSKTLSSNNKLLLRTYLNNRYGMSIS